MEVKNELDALMIAAQQTLSLSRDAEERLALLKEEIVLLESELSRNEEIGLALAQRLKELAINLGIVARDDAAFRDAEGLDEIESVIDDHLQARESRPIPQNVLFLANVTRERAKKQETTQTESVEKIELSDAVAQALASLTPREAKILRMRFGIDFLECTLAEVGKQFAITGERVRQIETKTLRKLRAPSRCGILLRHLEGLDLTNISTPEVRLLLAVFGYR